MQELTLMKVCMLIVIQAVTYAVFTSSCNAADKPIGPPNGVLWTMFTNLQPNLELAHPRVQYTEASLKQAKEKLANEAWANAMFNRQKSQADALPLTDEQIREHMPLYSSSCMSHSLLPDRRKNPFPYR
jgi:hypothetical protein